MQVAPVNAAGGPAFDASKHPSGIIPQLQNMVATVNLGCKLDLKQIALHARNSEYNPKARLSWFCAHNRASVLMKLPARLRVIRHC